MSNETDNKIDVLSGKVDSLAETVKEQGANLTDTIDALAAAVKHGFDRIDVRFDKVESRLEHMERRLDHVVEDHGQRIKRLEKKVGVE